MDEPTTIQALQTLKKPLYPKKQKKRYQPPQPDKHTYASQEDFVASLHAISLDDVEPEQKCPTCWKPFGEAPDFGFDNSELPVKLRCGHVFGNKCLANTFALPELSRLILEPLSFQAGKKGLQLGQMLNQYARTHGANFRDITEMFAHMLATMSTPGTCRDQLFGNYWFERFLDIQQIEGDLASITFMENAIVLDSKPPVPSIWNRATGSMDKTLLPSPPDSLNDTSLPSSSCEFGFATGYCEFPSMFPPPTTAKSLGLEPEVPQQGIAGPNDATQGTWQEALSNETKLDKLAALQKLNKDVPTAIDQALVNASIALAAEHKTKQKAHHVEHMAMQSEHMAHKKANQARVKRNVTALLATKLAEVYIQYAEAGAPSISANEKADDEDGPIPVFHTIINVHTQDRNEVSYKIPPPMYGMLVDESDDDASEASETDGIRRVLLIQRASCRAPCCAAKQVDGALPAIHEVTWLDEVKVPDHCPVCHRILFFKSRYSGRSRW